MLRGTLPTSTRPKEAPDNFCGDSAPCWSMFKGGEGVCMELDFPDGVCL